MTFKGSIKDIVPHDPPMVLLDRYISSDDVSLIAEVDISETSAFFEPGQGVPAYVGIEYIAQAISAFNGLSDYTQGKPVQLGFLLGSRKVEISQAYFAPQSTITVSVRVSFNDGEMAVFDGEILCAGDVLVKGRINAFQPAEPMNYIKLDQE